MLLALFFFLRPDQVSAGSLDVIEGSTAPQCTLRFSGSIESGDAEKFSDTIEELEAADQVICLNRNGGILIEAVKIAQEIRLRNIWTYVDAEKECLSACAIVFMAGSYTGNGGMAPGPRRILHPYAKLGFHAPSLILESSNYSAEETLSANRAVIEAVSRLVGLNDDSEVPMLPESLLDRMLEMGPNEFEYVDTVGEASAWGISVAPVNVATKVPSWLENLGKNLSNLFSYSPNGKTERGFQYYTGDIETKFPCSADDDPGCYAGIFGLATFFLSGQRQYMATVLLPIAHAPGGVNEIFEVNVMLHARWDDRWYSLVAPEFMFFEPEDRLGELPVARSFAHSEATAMNEMISYFQERELRMLSYSEGYSRPEWCDQAKQDDEIEICRNPALSLLEIEISTAFSLTRNLPGAKKIARERLDLRHDCGSDALCLREVMTQTKILFEDLQASN